MLYERVIREATRVDNLHAYINGLILCEVWRQLFLPPPVRRNWEERFPDLRLAA